MSAATTRQLWLAIHRYVGLATLAFLFIAAVTGCVLVLTKPLDAALNADLFKRPGAEALSPLETVAAFQAAHPDLGVIKFPLNPAAGETLVVNVLPRDPNAASGVRQAFLGEGGELVGARKVEPGWGRRHLVEGVFQFHFNLLAGNWGRWLMGVMALAWLLSNLVGLYLTLPVRGPFWKNWKKNWTINFKAKLAKLFLELHEASGLWLLILLTALAFTSVSMNFFSEAFTPAVEAVSPSKPSPFDKPPAAPPTGPRIGYEKALALGTAQAAKAGLEWRPAQLGYLPDVGLYEVMFTKSGQVNYSRLGPISYYLDGADGRLLYEDNPYTDSKGRKLSRSLYPLHSGQIAGWFGEAVIFILGLATVEQCVTGAYLWLKRRGPRIAGKKAQKARRLEAA